MGKSPIQQLSVLVTRSGRAGNDLVEQLKCSGVDSYHLPTLRITKLDYCLSAEDYQQAIFLSTNAVKFSVEQSQLVKDLLPEQIIAVGKATAQRLEKNALKDVIIPETASSEGLLNLPALQSIKGQQILIIKGRGGRELLQTKLAELGAICHELEVYDRVQNTLDMQLLDKFITAQALTKIVTFASVDGMNALIRQINDKTLLLKLVALVASERIAKKAAKAGFKSVVVADSASNEDMMASVITVNKNYQ